MLSMEEFVGSTNDQAVMRGKRTKRRHRPASPCASSATSSSGGGAESTEEEEDMANCLILLAQGGVAAATNPQERSSTRRFTEIMADSAVKVGFYVYECKTCNRTFSSFQALGGHRASHKRPKTEKEVVVVAAEEEKKIRSEIAAVNHIPFAIPIAQSSTVAVDREQSDAGNRRSPPLSLQFGHHNATTTTTTTTTAANQRSSFSKPNKTHDCSICGSEFTSGQALGGHMRRHRAAATATTTTATTTVATTSTDSSAEEEKRPRNILQLDLNLPAPEDDLRESKFQFSSAKQSIVFSNVPALVDCHY